MRNAVSQQHLLNALTAKKHREGPREGSGQNYIGCRVTRSLTTNLSSPRTRRDERAEPARVSECRRECLVDIKLSSAEPSRAGPGRAVRRRAVQTTNNFLHLSLGRHALLAPDFQQRDRSRQAVFALIDDDVLSPPPMCLRSVLMLPSATRNATPCNRSLVFIYIYLPATPRRN